MRVFNNIMTAVWLVLQKQFPITF